MPCAVFNCQSGYGHNTEKVRLFLFPNPKKKKKLFQKWLDAVNRKDLTIKRASISYVCEKHFAEEDWIRPELNVTKRGKAKKKRTLKDDAIPSLYMRGGAPELEIPNAEEAQKDHDYSYASTSAEVQANVDQSNTEVSSFVEVETGKRLKVVGDHFIAPALEDEIGEVLVIFEVLESSSFSA